MLSTLQEMVDLGLISPDEATEANAYCRGNQWHFNLMPAPLQIKLWLAWNLLEFDHEAPGTPLQ